MNMRKIIALLLVVVMVCGIIPFAALAEGETVNAADFDTITTKLSSGGDGGYTNSYTTANGWVTANSAIQVGGPNVANPAFPVVGPDNTHKAVCMNGKTSAPGSITSPTLTGGISKLTVNYTKMFTDTKLSATVTITEVATGTTYTHTIAKEADKNTKYEVWTDEWVLDTPIDGEFTIKMVNDCPSASTSNKDRMTILDIMWESYTAPAAPSNATYVFADYKVDGELGGGEATRQLDENVTFTISTGWLTTEARIYKNANAVIASKVAMSEIVLNAGYKNSTFDVYTSADGETWTMYQEDVAYVSGYGDVTITFAEPVNHVKIDAPNAQVRIKTMTVTFVGGSSTPEEPTPSEPTPSEPTPSEPTPSEPTPSEPVTPEVPEVTEPTVVDTPVAGTAYKFGMLQGKVGKVFYLKGGMSSYYMATTEDTAAAIDVYLEETTGGYYLYTMSGESKLYINMVVSGTHVNGAYEAAAKTVYTYDAESKTVIAEVDGAPYWFGTRNDNTYTTVGPCKTEYNGFYCQFYVVPGAPVTPEQPEVPEVKDPAADTELSIKDAIALGQTKEHNVYTEGKYYVTGVITEVYNTTYGNMKIADAEGNILTVYGTYSADGSARYDAMEVKPVAGDTVKVYGIIGQYNGTSQMKNGWIVEHTPAGTTPEEPEQPEVPEVPEEPETPAQGTIVFDDTSKRIEFTDEIQVWTENGITVTNIKDPTGTTNVANYYKPARFYAKTYLKIEFAGMTKLVVDCDTYKDYAATLQNSLASVTGITVTVEGDIVTIEFAEPTDALVIEALAGQIRVDSMTAYTNAAGGTTPEQPEQPEQPEVPEVKDPAADSELSIKDAIALGQTKEHNVFTENKYYVTGVITEVYNTTYGNMKITDAEGNILTIYGSYSADGSVRYDALEVKPVAGDTVKLYGVIGQYNGTSQMKNGWIVEHTPAQTPENPENPEQPEEPKVPETLAEQIAEAEKLNNGEHLPYESTITGTIIDEPKASDYNEGQYKFTVSDGTNTILCYYTPVADGVVPAKGDTATVVGKLTAYNGTAQFDETAIAVVVNNVPEQPENPEQPGTGDEAPETSGVSIVAMAVLSVLSGSALVLLKKKEF